MQNLLDKINELKAELLILNSDDPKNEEILSSHIEEYSKFFMLSSSGKIYYFSPIAHKKYDDLILLISNKILKNRFSISFIEKEINNQLLDIDSIEKLNSFLDYIKNKTSDLKFYIPLYGITLSTNELNLGVFSLKSRSKVINEIDESNSNFKTELILDISFKKQDQVFLYNEYQTDTEKALDITITQSNRLIDILNWIFYTIEDTEEKYSISLDEKNNNYIKYLSLENSQRLSTQQKVKSRELELDLTNTNVQEVILNEENSWLINLITDPKINDFYDAILKSIHWFSKFHVEYENDNKLLYLAISLEALLSEKISTTSYISDRVAFILGNDKETRLHIRDLTKNLYDLRSNIAHGNQINIVDDKNLKELEEITSKIIKYALEKKDNFNSLKDFKLAIDEQKYL